MKATVISLTESTRTLLEKMHFPEIPKEANYIAFTEDGEAQFFETLQHGNGFMVPQMTVVMSYDIPDITIE